MKTKFKINPAVSGWVLGVIGLAASVGLAVNGIISMQLAASLGFAAYFTPIAAFTGIPYVKKRAERAIKLKSFADDIIGSKIAYLNIKEEYKEAIKAAQYKKEDALGSILPSYLKLREAAQEHNNNVRKYASLNPEKQLKVVNYIDDRADLKEFHPHAVPVEDIYGEYICYKVSKETRDAHKKSVNSLLNQIKKAKSNLETALVNKEVNNVLFYKEELNIKERALTEQERVLETSEFNFRQAKLNYERINIATNKKEEADLVR